MAPPVVISLDEADEMLPPEECSPPVRCPWQCCSKGTFRSVFANRMTESIMGEAGRDDCDGEQADEDDRRR
ncbi:MAG: hypothetical protein MZV63_62555 [Marinilabiliales bacterium]|nr:hypothetical protein [Marinilabiliales bacterium]